MAEQLYRDRLWTRIDLTVFIVVLYKNDSTDEVDEKAGILPKCRRR